METEASEILIRVARASVNRNRNLSIGAKFFFAAVTTFCHAESYGGNEKGEWTISIAQLSQLINTSPSSISRWAKELQNFNYLTVKKVSLPTSLHLLNSYSVSTSQN
jgi:hypothetical protein